MINMPKNNNLKLAKQAKKAITRDNHLYEKWMMEHKKKKDKEKIAIFQTLINVTVDALNSKKSDDSGDVDKNNSSLSNDNSNDKDKDSSNNVD